MNDTIITLKEIKQLIAQFTKERDWNTFHTPKNLSMAIAAEAAELMELFLWVESKESIAYFKNKESQVKEELADIIIYLLCFANEMNIDVSQIIIQKIKLNAKKYPVEKCKGKSLKYNEL